MKKVCKIENCGSKHYARGWCYKHYSRNHRKEGSAKHNAKCIIEGCNGPALSRAMCSKHYQQSRRTAATTPARENLRTDYANMVEDCMDLLSFGVRNIEELWQRAGFVSEDAMRSHLSQAQWERVVRQCLQS